MAEKTLKVRYFFVGEDESLNRIPLARYQRILEGHPIYRGGSLNVMKREPRSLLTHAFCDINLMGKDYGTKTIKIERAPEIRTMC